MSDPDDVEDGWAEHVAAAPGRLTAGAAALLRPEAADLARNLETKDPEWYGRQVRRLGALPLRGGLVAFDPVGAPGRPLRFPVEVNEGVYPAYVLDADATDFMVVRFGGGRPASWHTIHTPDGAESLFPVEAATYAIADEATYDALTDDEQARAAVDVLLQPGSSGTTLPGRPHLGLALAVSGMDQLVWGYVGLTADDQVAAVAVALLTDCVYTYRPAAQDADAVARCEALVRALPEDDPGADEIRTDLWPDVQADLAAHGHLTTAGRNTVYELLAALED